MSPWGGGLAIGCGRAGWEHQRVAERKAGRCSSRKCAFSKLSLGKQSLILRCIPLVSNPNYIIPNPIHFICSAVKPGCFAKKNNHMPLEKIPLCHNVENYFKKNVVCVCPPYIAPFMSAKQTFLMRALCLPFACQHKKTFPRQLVLIEVQLKRAATLKH